MDDKLKQYDLPQKRIDEIVETTKKNRRVIDFYL